MWIVIGSFLNLILCLVAVVFPINALAEDITFEATVNANKISLQDMLELTLTVHGAKGDFPVMVLPAIDGFDYRYVGPATRFTIVNGVSSSEHSFIYNLFPSKVGHYKIPSIPLVLEGVTYQTLPIDIDVGEKTTQAANLVDDGEVGDQLSITDKVFMKSFVGSKEVYLGEKTPLVMKVFVNGLSLQLASAPYLTPNGFVADQTTNMQKMKEIVNGVNFDSLRFETNIYPTQTGRITIGPFFAQGELVYHSRRSNDIFGDLFSNTQTRPITLNAPEVFLNVLPLPLEGKPQDFSGAVGQYDFKASVGPSSVKVGDPLTLRMTITGDGRLKNLVFPVLNDSRFKIYDPQVKDDENSRTIEQVIIPTVKDITEVPELSFSYFDPKEKRYKTISQGPFPVKVLAEAKEQEFKAFGFIDKTKVAPEKSFIVKFDGAKGLIKNVLNKFISIFKYLWFWFFVLMAAALWIGYKIWREFQNRLSKDEIFAREWKADSKAKELLKNTKVYLDQNRVKEFYSSLYKTLNGYLADKMHVPLAGLNWPMIETHLKERSVDASQLQATKDLFERCDLVRFASAIVPQEQMVKDFLQLQDLIAYLPKILK